MTFHRLISGQSGASYRVTDPEPFALGRISVLFKGRDDDDRLVCIKEFRTPEELRWKSGVLVEFQHELDALRELKHSHILPFIDYGIDHKRDRLFMVFPLCEGGDLRLLMRTRDFFSFDQAIRILQQVAQAIDHAHSCGFVHGDVKPENVLFNEEKSHLYLGDFGMSKHFAVEEPITGPRGERPGGTTAYLSPEQIERHERTGKSDIYAFGMIAYELFTGKLPFDTSAPPFKQMLSKKNGELIDPREANPALSANLSTKLMRALHINPKLRPDSAQRYCAMLADPDDRPAGDIGQRSSAPARRGHKPLQGSTERRGQETVAESEARMRESTSKPAFPTWASKAGAVFGGMTLLFFMTLIVAGLFGKSVPEEAAFKFLTISVLALGVALTSAFLGGDAAAKGQLPIPLLNQRPIEFSVGSGVAVFVIVFLLVTLLYPA